MLNNGLTNFRAQAVDKVEHTFREVDVGQDFCEVIGRHWGQFRRFGHDGVTHQQGGCDLPREQVERKIPWRDEAHASNRGAVHMVDSTVVSKGWLGVVLSKICEKSEIGYRTGGVHPSCEGNGFSRVHALKLCNRFGLFFQGVSDSVKPRDPFFHGGGRPRLFCLKSGCRGHFHIVGCRTRERGDGLTVGRIERFHRPSRI